MVTFDDVLTSAVRVVETHPEAQNLERVCLVRDLVGRVRLAIKPSSGSAQIATAALEKALLDALAGYFSTPILRTTATGDEGRLASKLLELSQEWEPTFPDLATGAEVRVLPQRWRKIERRLSKQVWLQEGTPQPPWELGDGPGIVTFYSFKGGVGRSTALAACAWQLARQKKRVAVVDLDLEAPGLGILFEADCTRGVLDFLLDYAATQSRDITDANAPAQALGPAEAAQVFVFPAGKLGLSYLEKLARLDFLATGDESKGQSPTESALRALLHAIHKSVKPDYIFIDSRAGIHDLAGLSLHGLAHVDVLVSRASEQSCSGLDLAVQALASRKRSSLLAIVVYSLAPEDERSQAAQNELRDFSDRSYQIFQRYVYSPYLDDLEIPSPESRNAPHSPIRIPRSSALEQFSQLSSVEESLFSSAYVTLLNRVEELCAPEEAEEAT